MNSANPFQEFFMKLIGNEERVHYIMQWLAFTVQKPEVRIGTDLALDIYDHPGKETFLKILSSIYEKLSEICGRNAYLMIRSPEMIDYLTNTPNPYVLIIDDSNCFIDNGLSFDYSSRLKRFPNKNLIIMFGKQT